MKTPKVKIAIYSLLTIGHACFFSMGMVCLLNLLGLLLSISLDGPPAIEQFPRFIPFCFIVGLIALISLIGLVILNVRFSINQQDHRRVPMIQSICALALAVPMMKLWELLFDFLQNTF
jgi:hypothetical protein